MDAVENGGFVVGDSPQLEQGTEGSDIFYGVTAMLRGLSCLPALVVLGLQSSIVASNACSEGIVNLCLHGSSQLEVLDLEGCSLESQPDEKAVNMLEQIVAPLNGGQPRLPRLKIKGLPAARIPDEPRDLVFKGSCNGEGVCARVPAPTILSWAPPFSSNGACVLRYHVHLQRQV